MERNVTILNELREISKLVAGLPNHLPYSAPDGYFDKFPTQVMQLLQQEQTGNSSFIAQKGENLNPYTVPAGYFENLADNILNIIKTGDASPREELEMISPFLGQLEKKIPFTTPDGYFEELPSNAVAGINALDFVHAELEILS